MSHTLTTPLTLRSLTAHGLSERALGAWHARGIQQLLPLQAVAVSEFGLLQGRSAIIFAPTSAGKTLIAELAALRHLQERRRVILLVPTRALAEERGEEWRDRFGALGARVIVATRERPEADPVVLRGDWDILVAIYEKVRSYLVVRPSLLTEVGLVVADEIQLLGELGRGDTVELILTKVARAHGEDRQFLGLSAVLGDAERIGAWLDAEVLRWKERPVELREGVLNQEDGVFRYHQLNADTFGQERLIHTGRNGHSGDPGPTSAVIQAAESIAENRDESVLIFAPTKRLAREWATTLAERLSLPPAEHALDRITHLESTRDRLLLETLLRAGVGIHTADLSWSLRRLVEHAYDAGEIRLLVATSTLAQGVNLTGRNVLLTPLQVDTDPDTGEPVAVALSRARFQNAGGRAGRFGREADFGRAILIASTRDESERLMNHHIGRAPDGLRPGLERTDLAPVILDLVAAGVARLPSEIEEFLLATYTGVTRWQNVSPADWQDRWLDTLDRLEAARLVEWDEEGDLRATGIGLEVARAGIAIKTARLFTRWLGAIGEEPSPLETLWCAARSVDATECHCPLRRDERRSRCFTEALAEALADLGGPAHPMSGSWLQPAGGLGPADLMAAKRSLLLWAWIGPSPTDEIEERFGVHAGSIENMAGHHAWLVETLANMGTALGKPDAWTSRWRELAWRLPRGLPQEGVRWAGVRGAGLGRAHVRALVAEGFEGPEDLEGVGVDDLSRLVPRPIAQAVLSAESETPRPVRAPVENISADSRNTEESDCSSDSGLPAVDLETGTVHWLGEETRLTPKPAALLALLAERAPEAVSYREIEKSVWGRDEVVERQQISAHMRSIVRSLRRISAQRAPHLIEVRARQGLRLRLS
jgi:replicative superfamily II helicase